MIDKSSGKIGKSLLAILLVFLNFFTVLANSPAPEFFTYSELTELYEEETLPQPLKKKLDDLLTTPFVDNSFAESAKNAFYKSPQLGEFLRVAHWNIQRGLEYEAIEALFESRERFESILDNEKFPPGSEERREILEEAEHLRRAGIIILNEADLGMKRTDYRFVAAELAKKLKMNYAFGVQFVELTPIHLSSRKYSDAEEKAFGELVKVDPHRYKAMHGITILSRFPLENVRLIPFKNQPYDWYLEEKNGTDWLEKGKRLVGKKLFLEESLREVRRGGRTMLLADVVDNRLPTGRVTIVATHLENRTKPKNRVKQLEELLEVVKPIANPVIVAGDMNTSGSDLTPTSLQRELRNRYGNPRFWLKQGIQYALGFGLLENLVMGGLTFGRTMNDPTVKSIPFFSRNSERRFFATLKNFEFDDGGVFDFRGEKSRAVDNKRKTLANSNQRGQKGFITTYQVNRPFYIIGKYKLDWIFVKPGALKKTKNGKDSHLFAPHFGTTLINLNEAIKDRISDHRPLTIDLPLNEPRIE